MKDKDCEWEKKWVIRGVKLATTQLELLGILELSLYKISKGMDEKRQDK